MSIFGRDENTRVLEECEWVVEAEEFVGFGLGDAGVDGKAVEVVEAIAG